MSAPQRTSWKQRLHAATGDRTKEGEELARETKDALLGESLAARSRHADIEPGDIDSGDAVSANTDPGDTHHDDIDRAAQEAVRNAHGDPGVKATSKIRGDIATPADVADQAAQTPNSSKRQ